MMSCYVTSGNKIWQFGGLISQHFRTPKSSLFFKISPRAQLAYKICPIIFYRKWSNLNTVKISFCKVAVSLVKFAIEDLKRPKNVKTRLPYPYLVFYNTREECQHSRISVNPKNRNVQHTKKAIWHFYSLTLIFSRFTRPIPVVREPSPFSEKLVVSP